ncbi:MAG TPA: alpha/beta fold hydrolase [Myxococcota bacterium]|nr:alpha/beta fold hydrolase [Myxococcota bacterium]
MSPWFPPFEPATDARMRLFCVPFAGGGAGIYRTWPMVMGPEIQVLAVQLPGRERRLREAPYTAMAPLVDDLSAAIRPLTDRPWAIFGHSLGGAIAWEVAMRLHGEGRSPEHLIVSARRSPELPLPHAPLFALPDDRMVAETERHYGPLPAMLKQHPSLLATFLPTMRADFQLLDTWRPTQGVQLACPITTLAGAQDTAVPPDTMTGWARYTRGPSARHVLQGGHFYVRDNDEARDIVTATLRAHLGATA